MKAIKDAFLSAEHCIFLSINALSPIRIDKDFNENCEGKKPDNLITLAPFLRRKDSGSICIYYNVGAVYSTILSTPVTTNINIIGSVALCRRGYIK